MKLKSLSVFFLFFSACTTSSAPKEESPTVPDTQTPIAAVKLSPLPEKAAEKSTIKARGLRVVSWNLKQFRHKGQDVGAVIEVLASLAPDLIGVEEVLKGEGGEAGILEIVAGLSTRLKAKYCFAFSEVPTDAREKYAFLWRVESIAYIGEFGSKKKNLDCSSPSNMGVLPLATKFAAEIVREPGYGVFRALASGREFWASAVHLVPPEKDPAKEVPALFQSYAALGSKFAAAPAFVMGDFNLPNDNATFSAARSEKFHPIPARPVQTTLKSKSRVLANSYDSFFVRNAECKFIGATNTFDFFPKKSVSEVFYGLSDHLPISMDCDT